MDCAPECSAEGQVADELFGPAHQSIRSRAEEL